MKFSKNKNKGFSLVELIVVIAIMAVMVAVLAPSLLAYVERSRAQKDTSAMGEVANAIQLALADERIYDEVMTISVKNNASCYIDTETEAEVSEYKMVTKENGDSTEYTYTDDTRLADERPYKFAGNMRGLTITMYPCDIYGDHSEISTQEWTINLGYQSIPINGLIDYSAVSDRASSAPKETDYLWGALYDIGGGDRICPKLLANLRSTIGEKVTITSQTYRLSCYTVFIRMGTTGGNSASSQDAVKVYGQWNGTNLTVDQSPVSFLDYLITVH